MRVAHFCDSEPGRVDGVAASAGLSVALLRSAGHQVSHYYPGPLLRGGMRSVAVPFRQIRVAVPWARAKTDADVVHVHSTGPVGMAGFRLAEARRLPLVLTWHTDLLAYADHFPEIPLGAAYCAARLRLGWTVREYLELADRDGRRHARLVTLGRAMVERASLIIAPSEKTAAGLAEFGDLPPVWTVPTPVVVPAGVATRDALRAELDLPADAAVVLSVGRVTREKNPLLLLRAFARLLVTKPYARLVLLGVRQGRRSVLARIRALGLTGSVLLVPPVPRDRVAGYYRMADVLAFASTTDTQSLVVAEAEAAGLPVVSADAALARRPGAAAPPRVTCEATPDALAAALLRMLDDGELRERTRRAGLQAAGAYPPERFLSLLTAAYDRAAGGRAHAPATGGPRSGTFAGMSVRFGIFVPQGWKMDLVEIADPVEQYEAMTAVARAADAGPWDSVWVYDHFHTIPEPTINTTFECWTVTSTLARDTSRVNIGQMVGCNGYRQPSLYAKIASTVDVASNGRLYAGLGAGWYEHEWKAYGYDWTEVPQRMGEFREAVQVVHKMWTEEQPVFSGRHYSIDKPINEPKGVRKPHPSFWLGGGGEKVTLKLVAQYADACNVGGGDPELIRRKLDVLRRHCDDLGRDYDRIIKSTGFELDLAESTADTIGRVERIVAAGADYVIVYVPRVAYDHEPMLRFARDVIPQFA